MSKQDTVPGTPGPWRERAPSSDPHPNLRLMLNAPALYNALNAISIAAHDDRAFRFGDPGPLMNAVRAAERVIKAIDPEMRPWPMREGGHG